MAEWPLLFLGPILRRVTESSVSVFVATRDRVDVTLTVYSAPDPDGFPITGSPSARTVSVGHRLHLCVATAFGTFEPGHLYGYNVELAYEQESEDGFEENTHTLGSMGLLGGGVPPPYPHVPLGYTDGWLPSFVLPPNRHDLKLVQVSCRKPHGCHPRLTDPDVLPLVDRLIGDNLERPAKRPHQLVMTGDQIYADDVPAAMLAAITSIGRELLAWSSPETFPDRRGIETLTDSHVRLDPGKRSLFLDDQGVKNRSSSANEGNRTAAEIDALEDLEDDEPLEGGNWEDYAANHLLFLGEWCAMYLMAWSPTLWLERDAVDPQDRIVDPNLSLFFLPRPTEFWVHSPDTTTPALIYAEGLPYVRRALANVPTYMAADDHEITDDWFLNGSIDVLLRKGNLEEDKPSTGGRRLMRNGLIAYALFQHWGNVPGDFDLGTPAGTLLDLVDLGSTAGAPGSATPPIGRAGREHDADVVLDVGAEPVGPDRVDERIRWDYEVLFPEHRLLVLDTRTWRAFPGAVVDVSAADLVAAAEERTAALEGWGTTELHGLAAAWASTAQAVSVLGERTLSDLLGAGAAVVDNAASLADAVRTPDSQWPQYAAAVVDQASALIVALGETDAAQSFPWASEALQDAEARIALTWSAGAGVEIRAEALRAGACLEAAAVLLQAGVPGVIERFAVAGIAGPFDAAAAGLWRAAEFLRCGALFLQWAVVSPGLGARSAGALAAAWLTLAHDLARVLFAGANPSALAALDSATAASTTLRAAFAAVEQGWKDYVDPVWQVLVGSGNATLNAELISGEALQFQVVERLAQPLAERPLTIVVSPAPVFDHPTVFFLIRAVIATSSSRLAASEWENEPWGGNPRALHRLLEALSELESAVILSGDVHYACSSVNDYSAPGREDARFVQLTSSSVKNSWEPSTALARYDSVGPYDMTDLRWLSGQMFDLLPTLEERTEFSNLMDDLVPSWENAQDALQALAVGTLQELEELGDDAADAYEKVTGLPAALKALRRSKWDLVDRLKLKYYHAIEWAVGPVHWYELMYTYPLASQQTLLLLNELGIDLARLPRVRSTMLQDLRAAARIHDSPGLDTTITEQAKRLRDDILTGERRTVGSANLGLVRFESVGGVGETVVHDLYSFPVDLQPEIKGLGPPPFGPSFRDDWIITRHAAGLTFGGPADVGVWAEP